MGRASPAPARPPGRRRLLRPAVAALLAAGGVLLLLGLTSRAPPLPGPIHLHGAGGGAPHRYVLVIDAGSSGTRM